MKEKIAWSMIFAAGGLIVLLAAYKLHGLNRSDSALARPATISMQAASMAEGLGVLSRNAGGRERPFVTIYRETPPNEPRAHPDDDEPQANAKPAAASADDADTAPEITTAVAEAALIFVGTDDSAEQVWAQAINDPDRPEEERQTLIEGLSQAGFSDPVNPTTDDLDLIDSRLALIEDYGPGAIDEVNRLAFQVAYRRLLAMQTRASAQSAN